MTTIYVDSRKRVSGSDSNFAFELPETLHMHYRPPCPTK